VAEVAAEAVTVVDEAATAAVAVAVAESAAETLVEAEKSCDGRTADNR